MEQISLLDHDTWRDKKIIKSIRRKGKMVCCNCGSDKRVQLHHIVPIAKGGNDIESNIVPLCFICHQKAHGHNLKEDYNWKSGRKRNPLPKDSEKILTEYLRCKIGKSETLKRLNLSNCRLSQWYGMKEYLQRQGITDYRNNIDIRLSKGRIIRTGDPLGWVRYNSGKIEKFYAEDKI